MPTQRLLGLLSLPGVELEQMDPAEIGATHVPVALPTALHSCGYAQESAKTATQEWCRVNLTGSRLLKTYRTASRCVKDCL